MEQKAAVLSHFFLNLPPGMRLTTAGSYTWPGPTCCLSVFQVKH